MISGGSFALGSFLGSGIYSRACHEGTGGDIAVSTGAALLENGGTISAESFGTNNAGNINLDVFNHTELYQGTIASAALAAAGGNISIQSPQLHLNHNSQITSSVASGIGGGGNIDITAATFSARDNSDISARADQGYGGNLTLNANAMVRSFDSNLDASSNIRGREGKVQINSPVDDISAGLFLIPESFLKIAPLLPETCYSRDPSTTSGFTVKGREELLPDPAEGL